MQYENGIQVLCFGGEDWWYHNRGHIDMQLMRRFAAKGTVLYVNSIVMQKPKITEGSKLIHKIVRKVGSISKSLQKSDAGFWVYSPLSLPLHHKAWGRRLNTWLLVNQLQKTQRKLIMEKPIIWVACPAACEAALKLEKSFLVYQKTDRYEEFPNVDTETIGRYDAMLRQQADLTIFVNETLYKEQGSTCRRSLYLDHGVDYDLFASALNSKQIPPELSWVPRPIVGFFGGIDDHTFDYQFMLKVVELLPKMSFVFVGKASLDCKEMQSKKNVFMLGARPYEQIPGYGKCFDVAIMPWRQNKWIQGCNPIKLKEYLSLGKPIVSTPFTELEKYSDVTYAAKTPQEFANSIKKAIAENSPARAVARQAKVACASWESKAQIALDAIFAAKPCKNGNSGAPENVTVGGLVN